MGSVAEAVEARVRGVCHTRGHRARPPGRPWLRPILPARPARGQQGCLLAATPEAAAVGPHEETAERGAGEMHTGQFPKTCVIYRKIRQP